MENNASSKCIVAKWDFHGVHDGRKMFRSSMVVKWATCDARSVGFFVGFNLLLFLGASGRNRGRKISAIYIRDPRDTRHTWNGERNKISSISRYATRRKFQVPWQSNFSSFDSLFTPVILGADLRDLQGVEKETSNRTWGRWFAPHISVLPGRSYIVGIGWRKLYELYLASKCG